MKARASLRFDLTQLSHPSWWAALAILLINDNLLKGSGLVPGWLTGKLSDFAFLIVAPVVLAALLPVGLWGRRTLAVVAVAGLFVVTDLSPTASDAVVAMAARLGMRWRLWPDPTDLVALAGLPWTIRLLCSPPRAHVATARVRRWSGRIGVVAGALACLATSAPPSYGHVPFFLNRTASSVELRVTWLLRSVDCKERPEQIIDTLAAGDLDDARTMTVASGQVAALDGPPRIDQSPAGQCALRRSTGMNGERGPCVAALLEVAGARPIFMMAVASWRETDNGPFFSCSRSLPLSKCAPRLNPASDPGRDAVSLLGSASHLDFGGVGLSAPDPRLASPQNRNVFVPVSLARVNLDTIAMRGAPDGSCRALRDAYHAQIAPNACASDSQCRATGALPLPGEDYPCTIYVNKASFDSVSSIEISWTQGCILAERKSTQWGGTCPPAQPAVCHAGSCAALCPNVHVEACPERCSNIPGRLSSICEGREKCLDDEDRLCSCDSYGGPPTCEPLSPAAPDCPLTCLEWPKSATPADGGTLGPDASPGRNGDDAGSSQP